MAVRHKILKPAEHRSMILFLDTEFTHPGGGADLLSLALVSEDGAAEFYFERSDVPLVLCSEFVLENVLPQFGDYPDAISDYASLRQRLRAFIESLPAPLHIGCDLGKDFAFLEQALGEPWPWQVDRRRLRLEDLLEAAVWTEAETGFFELGFARHHALNDARALRAGYLAWRNSLSP